MGVKNIALLSGLPLVAAGVLTSAIPAEAATFGDGQLDLSNLPFGNAIYTRNAIDFTRANDANGVPISNPNQSGFVNVSATGSLAGLSGQAEIFDLFSPVDIVPDQVFTGPPTRLLKFGDGTEYFFDSVTRTGSDTGVQNFRFEGFFLNNGDQTRSTFAFVTGQAPVPISQTTFLSDISQIDDPGTVTGFTSYSGTILTRVPPPPVPEPSATVALVGLALGAGSMVARKKTSNKI
jgi:hypothetical protein